MKYLRSLFVIIFGLFVKGSLQAQSRARSDAGGAAGESRSDDGQIDGPSDLSKSGWKRALKETKIALKDKNLSMMAAGLAYYTTLTFFPAVLGLATLYTSIVGGDQLLNLLDKLYLALPPAMTTLLQRQLTPLAHAGSKSLGIATLISFALVLWTMSGGLQNLVKATNVAYDVEESRNFIKLRLVSIVLAVAFIVFAGIIVILLILQGSALHAFGVPMWMADWFPWLRWPLIIIVVSIALAVIYRYAPNRSEPKWSWVSWGAAAATIIWLIVTVLFFFYVQRFGNYNKSYGIFASLIILMIWFNLSSQLVLVGAQVNKKLEDVAQ
jgi:membrane protein